MKLLRTIRLDTSDTFIFHPAAEPGEWAVSGAFAFSDDDLAALAGKRRAAFRSGFLGIRSFGWSTLAQIVEVEERDREVAVETLSQQLVARFGAPGTDEARAAAQEEIAFAASLCDQPADTLIAVYRTLENGEIRESFRTLRPRPNSGRLPAFSFFNAPDEEEQVEQVDIAALSRGKTP